MTPNDICSTLRRLEALAQGWGSMSSIPAIERDLAMERLREIYDMLLIANESDDHDDDSESINLDDVLSVGVVEMEILRHGEPALSSIEADPTFEILSEPKSPSQEERGLEFESKIISEFKSESEPNSELEDMVLEPKSPLEQPIFVTEYEEPTHELQIELESKSESELELESELESKFDPKSEIEFKSELDESLENEELQEVVIHSEESEENLELPEVLDESLENEELQEELDRLTKNEELQEITFEQVEVHKKPAVNVQASESPVFATTLFGMDEPEELLRHRQKQRAMMSLYDVEEPRPISRPVITNGFVPNNNTITAEANTNTQSTAATEPSKLDKIKLQLYAESQPISQSTTESRTRSTVGSVAELQPQSATESRLPSTSESQPISQSTSESQAAIKPVLQTELNDDDDDFTIEEFEIDMDAQTSRAQAGAGAVLGEVIGSKGQTVGESFTATGSVHGTHGESKMGLRRMIGINDRYLMIRDLFDGDDREYEMTIDVLNGFDDLDDCMIYIAENYMWNPNSDGAKLLIGLLDRKLA